MSNQVIPAQHTWPLRDSEWELLVTLPGRVVIAATSARRTVAEGLAGLDAIAAGRSSVSPLVREVVSAVYQEEGQERQPRAADPPAVLAACREAVRLLGARVDRADADAYRRWLLAIGTRVCYAARAGGLLGVGGAALAPAERRFLAELTAALTA